MPTNGGTVIGRQEELDLLPEGALEGREVFVINELASIRPDESNDDGSYFTSLHAKLYVTEYGTSARVLLGSANATDAAFSGNVEVLAELRGPRSQLGIDAILGVGDGMRSILEPYDRCEPSEPAEQHELSDLLRDVAAVPFIATVSPAGDALAVRLTSETALPLLPDGFRLTAELVTRRGEAADLTSKKPVDHTFTGLAVVDVTPFFAVVAHNDRGEKESTVVCAQLVGDPAHRLDEVIARQIDTPEKFLRFLALLLGLADGTSAIIESDGGGRGSWIGGNGPGVFELLMRGLVDHPDQLADLARLVERLQSTEKGQLVLPDGFVELWGTVDAVRRDMVAEGN